MIKVDKYTSIDRGADPNKEYYINQNGTYISLTKDELENIASDLKLLGIADVILSLPDIRNKLSPIKNLIAMLENSEYMYHHETEVHKMIEKEIEECKKSIAYLSGNGA